MARQMTVEMTDDLNPDTPADETVQFSLDGIGYEIDLAADNAERMRSTLEPWIAAARKTGGRFKGRRPIAGGSGMSKQELAVVRQWAQSNGMTVADRGRIPQEVITAYHSRNRKSDADRVAAALAKAQAKVDGK